MAFPTINVKASFSTTRFATPSWTSLAGVRSVGVETGRKSELEGVGPGTLSALLDNDSRRYDPNNTAGAYYPNLTPGKRCKVVAKYTPSTGAPARSYVNIGAQAVGSNASVTPALPAGWAADDVFIMVASIRNSGTGTVVEPSGWRTLVSFGNVSVFARRAVTGDTAPTVSFSNGVANATTTAVIHAWRGLELDLDDLMATSATQLNASAQNIAVPGLTMTEANLVCLVIGWKQDDWTSVATLTGQGFTEILDGPTTTGDDAGVEIQYRIQTTATNFTATNLVPTGGAAAISRGIVLALRPNAGTPYELFNGWTDGWPQDWQRRMGTTTMKASGPFQWLARTEVPDPYRETVLADGPLAYYRLSDAARRTIRDDSGGDHHGVWSPEIADVRKGEGLILGSDGAVTLPAAPAYGVGVLPLGKYLTSLRPLTVEFWIQIDKVPKTLTNPLDLGAELWSAVVTGGGINVRIWADTNTYPGAIDFIINDAPTLVGSNIATATTAFFYWYYNICDGQPHHVACTIDSTGGFMCIYVDGIDRAPYNNFTGTIGTVPAWGDTVLNFAGGWQGSTVLDEFAIYDFEFSQADAEAHYEAGTVPGLGQRSGERIGYVLDLVDWPSSFRDLDTGQTVLGVADAGGTKALDYMATVARSEQGLLYEAHNLGPYVGFQDRGGRLTDTRSTSVQSFFSDDSLNIAFNSAIVYSGIELANDDRPAANIVKVNWVGGTEEARSQTSVDTYGEIPATLDTVLERQAEAINLAEWVLAEQSALFTRIRSITIKPAAHGGTAGDLAWTACLSRVEGDRVRVVHKPANSGASIDQHLIIIGKEHKGGKGTSEWETTFYFSRAITSTYWVLGTGALGSTTVLAY